MFGFARAPLELPDRQQALPGRETPIETAPEHFVNGRKLKGPYPENCRIAYFALGCYWGAERLFWTLPGVWVTAVGNSGGQTPNPTYEEICTGKTGHAEAVMVVYDPDQISYERLLQQFWESHDPTQGMRQGNDIGTQYRSGIYYCDDDQKAAASASQKAYQAVLQAGGFGPITTEIVKAGPFYFAESYHQQYLAKNPSGYCGLGGTGLACAL